jgi:hypothetical protein
MKVSCPRIRIPDPVLSLKGTIYVSNSCILLKKNALITGNTSAGLVLRARVFPHGSAMRFRFVIYKFVATALVAAFPGRALRTK